MEDGDKFLIVFGLILAPVAIGLVHNIVTAAGPAQVMEEGEYLGSLEDVEFGSSACKISVNGSEYVFSYQGYRYFTFECDDIRLGDPVYRYGDEIHVVKERWRD